MKRAFILLSVLFAAFSRAYSGGGGCYQSIFVGLLPDWQAGNYAYYAIAPGDTLKLNWQADGSCNDTYCADWYRDSIRYEWNAPGTDCTTLLVTEPGRYGLHPMLESTGYRLSTIIIYPAGEDIEDYLLPQHKALYIEDADEPFALNIHYSGSNINLDIIGSSETNITYSIFDISGRAIVQPQILGNSQSHAEVIDASAFNDGLYIIKVIAGKEIFIRKVMVAR